MSPARKKPGRWVVWALVGLSIASLAGALVVGPVTVPLGDALGSLFGGDVANPIHRVIVGQLRAPRALLAFLVGAALAVSGVIMQGLFRNPLASPYILGVASGASTGAALAIVLASSAILYLPLGAFLGASIAVLIVYALARGRRGRTSIFVLILAGVAVGSLFSAITSFLLYLSSGGEKLADVLFWILGGLGRASWSSVLILAPIVAIGLAGALFVARDLNVLALGEEGAGHVGVNSAALTRWLLLLTTVLTAAAVSMAGTIGFIGLVVPHAFRMLVGPDHRRLIPVAALGGGCFLIWADMIARTAFAPAELPVGVITAFLGAPFFLYLLKTRGANL